MSETAKSQSHSGENPDRPMILFCVRADSDADHLVPVIDALAKQRRHAVRVVIYDPLKTFQDDYRFLYLRNTHGIEAEHIFALPSVGSRSRVTAGTLRALFGALLQLQRWSPVALFTQLLRKPLLKIQKALKSLGMSQEIKQALTTEVDRYHSGLVVFDHTINPLAEVVTRAARRRGISTLALPHSIPHLSDLPREALTQPDEEEGLNWGALYDRIVLPNAPTAERFALDCRDRSLLATLGSARFSRCWGQTLDAITPKFDWRPGSKKVLFILSKKGPYVDWQEVNRVSALLCGDPRLAVAFKPHPRTEVSGLPAITSGPRTKIASAETPTASLVQWADLVIFWGSSVIYDAVRLRKPALHLGYLFRLHFDFEPYLSSWTVKGFDEFRDRLDHFIETGEPTYSEAEARACAEALVEGGNTSAIEGYLQLIDEMISGRPECRPADLRPAKSITGSI